MKRRLKIAALALGLLVVVMLSFLAWVINTEAGLRFAVARLPEKLGKVTLKIEEVRGTITVFKASQDNLSPDAGSLPGKKLIVLSCQAAATIP